MLVVSIFFSKIGPLKLGVRLIYRGGLYIDFYVILVLKEVFLERESFYFTKTQVFDL